jgi:8-oxo-dGTP diphosphatase
MRGCKDCRLFFGNGILIPMRKQRIPVFGTRNNSLPQKTRLCAYAVIADEQGRIAAVEEEHGRIYLPGGGVEFFETPGQALHREVMEELGCKVQVITVIGQSLHYLESEGQCQATYATFYSAELGEKVSADCEHQLKWVAVEDFFHASQSWAAQHYLVLQAAEQLSETANVWPTLECRTLPV